MSTNLQNVTVDLGDLFLALIMLIIIVYANSSSAGRLSTCTHDVVMTKWIPNSAYSPTPPSMATYRKVPRDIGVDVAASLKSVRTRASEAFKKTATVTVGQPSPRLVAVSKTKPPELVVEAYRSRQRHFGENYVQELLDKANHSLLVGLEDIRWHFIGHLQRNKCNNLTSVPHLWCVETVDSERLATSLDASWKKRNSKDKLKVFVQVNSSYEESKHGCHPDKASEIVRHVRENCEVLDFQGLMTIRKIDHDYSSGPNPD